MATSYKETLADEATKQHTRHSDVSAEIIVSLNKGEHEAFEYIYLHYSDALTDFLCALLKSREEAEEIMQEVFMNLWIKRGIFDPEKGIKRYLFQMAKFHALNHFDKIKVKDKYKDFHSRIDLFDLPADDIVSSQETSLLIEIALMKMPPRQREVFRMSREQNISYEEIALALGISKNKVRNHISAALSDLRKIFSAFVYFLSI